MTEEPTPEQIEARNAALEAWQEGSEIRRYSEFFTSFEDGYNAALVAASGAAPQEPAAWERVELIKALRDKAQTDSPAHSLMREAADALAAVVRVDEAKLASLLQEHRPSQWRSFASDTLVYRCCGEDFGRLTGSPRRTDRDSRELWEEHMASKLAEWLRGGQQ